MMGSPHDELGRQKNESPHEVEITAGFWMADTCCSQELWKQILGENPAEYQSPENPVENVSWYDTQRFLQAISIRL